MGLSSAKQQRSQEEERAEQRRQEEERAERRRQRERAEQRRQEEERAEQRRQWERAEQRRQEEERAERRRQWEREVQRRHEEERAEREREAQLARDGAHWLCLACTLRNSINSDVCAACTSPRPEDDYADVDDRHWQDMADDVGNSSEDDFLNLSSDEGEDMNNQLRVPTKPLWKSEFLVQIESKVDLVGLKDDKLLQIIELPPLTKATTPSHAQTGSSELPAGTPSQAQTGSSELPAGTPSQAQTGSSELPAGTPSQAQTGTSELPAGTPSQAQTGSSELPAGTPSQAQTGSSELPAGTPNQAQTGSSELPAGTPSQAQTGPAELPAGTPSQAQTGSSELPAGTPSQAQTGSSELPAGTPNQAQTGSSELPAGTPSQAQTGPAELPAGTPSQAQTGPSELPAGTPSQAQTGPAELPAGTPSQAQTGSSELTAGTPSQAQTGPSELPAGTPSQAQTGPAELPAGTPSQAQTGSSELTAGTPSQAQTGPSELPAGTPSQAQTGPAELPAGTPNQAQTGPAELPAGTPSQAQTGSSELPAGTPSQAQTGPAELPAGTPSQAQTGPAELPAGTPSQAQTGPAELPAGTPSQAQTGSSELPAGTPSQAQTGPAELPAGTPSQAQTGPAELPAGKDRGQIAQIQVKGDKTENDILVKGDSLTMTVELRRKNTKDIKAFYSVMRNMLPNYVKFEVKGNICMEKLRPEIRVIRGTLAFYKPRDIKNAYRVLMKRALSDVKILETDEWCTQHSDIQQTVRDGAKDGYPKSIELDGGQTMNCSGPQMKCALPDTDERSLTDDHGNKDSFSHEEEALLESLASQLDAAQQTESQKERVVTIEIMHLSSVNHTRQFIKHNIPSNLQFTIQDIKQVHECKQMIAHLMFDTQEKAKQAVYFLNKNSDETLVNAYIGERKLTQKQKKAIVLKNWEEVEQNVENQKDKHDKKINVILKELENNPLHKNLPLHIFSQVSEKREALDSKLDELRAQKREFIRFVSVLRQQFSKVSEEDNIQMKIQEYRKSFGQESSRLEAALPIYSKRREIIDSLREHQICVVIGETGSGKSTQMVQYLHQAGYADKGIIVCTQPRKVAAQSLAKHVAEEMSCRLGEEVGYQVGMHSKMSSKTGILYVTDHVLLNDCIKDPSLAKYSCVVIDEAHERTIYTDLLIGMIKRCMDKRSELKLIITSATINPEVFLKFFKNCPLLKVSGRLFPVDVVWKTPYEAASDDWVEESLVKVREIHELEPAGDILVFLTTPLETEKACEKLEARPGMKTELQCLALHGRLKAEDQQKVFRPAPSGKRKVVFATNSAETSITIPGIKYIVDTGKVKERQYDAKRNMSSLVIKLINKSSAEQRKGRAGRTQAGKCFRLYTEEEFNAMEPMPVPEILRVHLGMALMKIMELGIDEPLAFDFLDSPSPEALKSAMNVLEELGAVKENKLTNIGEQMAKLSIEPRLAKLILMSITEGIGFEGLAVAAMSTVGSSVFFRMGTEAEKQQSDKRKMKFCNPAGDFVTMLNVFREWYQCPDGSKSTWCTKNSINAKSMRISRDALNEFKDVLAKDLSITLDCKFADTAKTIRLLPKIVLQCFSVNLGVYSGHKRVGYFLLKSSGDESLAVHPSSSIEFIGSLPKLVVYEAVLKTSQNFMMTITPVKEEWLDILAQRKETCDLLQQMEENLLCSNVVAELGQSLIAMLLENKAQKLKALIEEAKEHSKYPHIMLDINRDKGILVCLTKARYQKTVQIMVQKELNDAKHLMGNECQEIPITVNSAVRVVLQRGGCKKKVLMPDQYRTVIVHKVQPNFTKNMIEKTLSQHGTVSEVIDITPRKPRGGSGHPGSQNKIFKVIFENPENAKHAVDSEQKHFVVKPEKGTGSMDDQDCFKVKFTWNRRKAKGIAFIKLKSVESAQIVLGSCRRNDMYIGNRRAKVSISNKDESQLFIGGLDMTVTKEEIEDALKEHVHANDISNISVPRVHVGTTTPDELDSIQRQLSMKIKHAIGNDDFNVEVLKPLRDTQVDFRAIASFSDPEDGVTVQDQMDWTEYIQGTLLSAKADLKTSVLLRKQVHEVINMEGILDEEKISMNVEYTSKQLRSGCYVYDVHTTNVDDLQNIKKKIEDITKGVIVQCRSVDMFRNLASNIGMRRFETIMHQTKTHIELDRRVNTVTIYGEEGSVQDALTIIEEYLVQTKDTITKGISLLCGNHPPGIMRELVVKYGTDLEKLRTESGMYAVDLIVRQHILKATGSLDAHERLLKLVHQTSEEVASRIGIVRQVMENGFEIPDCPVCLCEVDEDMYRLNFCCHAYCKTCILSLVASSIRAKDIPMKCVKEDCGEFLVVKDFYCLTTKESWIQLALVSINTFVSANPNFKYCITPNCPMFYRTTRTQGSFKCPECHMSMCTACHAQNHQGFTCEMFKVNKGDVDYGLKEYLKKDRKNRATCPRCNIPIEKNGGCNHVTCAACKIHICWSCKRTFRGEAETYDHMAQCQGVY